LVVDISCSIVGDDRFKPCPIIGDGRTDRPIRLTVLGRIVEGLRAALRWEFGIGHAKPRKLLLIFSCDTFCLSGFFWKLLSLSTSVVIVHWSPSDTAGCPDTGCCPNAFFDHLPFATVFGQPRDFLTVTPAVHLSRDLGPGSSVFMKIACRSGVLIKALDSRLGALRE
jgi:hypothetical protein